MAAIWQRLRKYLRIAVTAVSLLVCVLLIALWVRSYFTSQILYGHFFNFRRFDLLSHKGTIGFRLYYDMETMNVMLERKNNVIRSLPIELTHYLWEIEQETDLVISNRWYLESNQYYQLIGFAPHWFFLTIFATIAAVPWLKWRFSLRTLLIVMTLFALFFGAVAWSMRG